MVEFISISLDTNKKAWKEKMKQLNMHGHQYIVTGIRPEIKIGKRLSMPITAGIHAMRPAEMVDGKLKSMFQDKGYYFQIAPYVSTGLQIGF